MNTLPAGTYYVGDLCYVLDSVWDKVCEQIISGETVKNGIFNLDDGTQFAIYSTKYGDGIYKDEIGNEYAVDSGSIGCVKIDNLLAESLNSVQQYSAVVSFDQGLTCYEDNGVIYIGDIVIDTNE
jgi:hypothetical protein